MSGQNQNKANFSNLDHFNDGETVYIYPLGDIDFKIPVRIQRINAQKTNESLKSLGISRFKINCPIDRRILDEIMEQILNMPDEFEELWHRDYGEIDSGNIIDSTGKASQLLDKIAYNLEWAGEYPRFDKFIYRKRDNYNLSEFHADHYCSKPERTRKYGVMKRALINLGYFPRCIAVLDIPSLIVKKNINDPYAKKDYKKLLTRKNKWDMFLIETAPPFFKERGISGLLFDSFSTVHCGFGKKGDFCAVISKWFES